MAKEIERKFLVNKDLFIPNSDGEKITQAYLSIRPESTVRIRIKANKAFITVKSKNIGAVRSEWEYEIPVSDATEILQQCDCLSKIEKTRYRDGRWEIDVFEGRHKGLILAEIELETEDENFIKPRYIVREVTDDNQYYNSNLGSSNNLPPIF